MKDATIFSNKMYDKFINDLFIPIGEGWFSTLATWMIDSKFRTSKRLDKFLAEQLNNPDERLIATAKNFQTGTFEQRIIKILQFVYHSVQYMSEEANFGKAEYWASAVETLTRKRDDCDGLNALIYILARLSGIPAFMVWCCVGNTATGGHFWVMFYSGGNFYPIDATFYPDMTSIKNRYVFSLSIKKYTDIWYLFNEGRIYKYK